MDVIFTIHKGQYLDTVEKYPHTRKRKSLQINDSSAVTKNKIFDVIVKHDP